jgi:hypothetical protein
LFTAVRGGLVYWLVYTTLGREKSLTHGSETIVRRKKRKKLRKATSELDEEPDALDLARDPNKHLAFRRGGMHHCLEAPPTRLEGQIAIGTFLQRFPQTSLAVTPGSLRWRRRLFLR